MKLVEPQITKSSSEVENVEDEIQSSLCWLLIADHEPLKTLLMGHLGRRVALDEPQ